MRRSVMLHTSFFIRLLKDEDALHLNAKNYFKYFLEKGVTLKVSTISIAEYCVVGKLEELPLKNIQILPFNLKDAERAGEFAEIIFKVNKISKEKLFPRAIIPNDSKLFAQSDIDKTITHFITSDLRSKKTLALLKKEANLSFEVITMDIPYNEAFGILDL